MLYKQNMTQTFQGEFYLEKNVLITCLKHVMESGDKD